MAEVELCRVTPFAHSNDHAVNTAKYSETTFSFYGELSYLWWTFQAEKVRAARTRPLTESKIYQCLMDL